MFRLAKWIWKNPKKSIFFGSIAAYGANYGNNKYKINNLMREYCEEASKYGDVKVKNTHKLKKLIVLINPAADKRNAEDNFNKFCAPILNLAGFMIEIVKTQSESHAIRYFEEEMKEFPDAVIFAGGSGTIHESLTGLMRRMEMENADITVGVLPLGQFNQFSLKLLNVNMRSKVDEVRALAEGALSIVKGHSVKKDLMKIEVLSDENEEKIKPFYAAASIFWGSFNDILNKRDKYWFTNGLRNYTAFLFNGFHRSGITWECKAKMIYSPPCTGCSNCYEKVQSHKQKIHNSRWWSKFNAAEKTPEYSKILNPRCLETTEVEIDTSELAVTTNAMESSEEEPKLNVRVNSKANDYGFGYILSSWKRLRDREFLNIPETKIFTARQFKLIPAEVSGGSRNFSIDDNTFEVRPIKVTILPKRLDFFVP